jgi:hypothetical protein
VPKPKSWSHTGTQNLSKSAILTTTHTADELSQSPDVTSSRERLTITRTSKVSFSESWGCVDRALLTTVLSPMMSSASPISLKNSDIRNGTTISLRLPPLNDTLVQTASQYLHIPWFDRWEARASIRVLQCPNQEGFADAGNRDVPLVVVFPLGITSLPPPPSAAAGGRGGVLATLVIPPIPTFNIYSQERVAIDIFITDLTLGTMCESSTTAASDSMYTHLIDMNIEVNVDELLSSAQESVTPIVAVMTAVVPFAAPDLQVLVALALMPCSNSYQKRTFAMFRALSVFTLDDSYEGVLWGNLIANVAGLGLHVAVVGVVSVVTKRSLGEAMTTSRFPSLYLQLLWQLTYASNVFAAVQILAGDDNGNAELKALAAGVLVLFGGAIPGAIYVFLALRAEAAYYIFQYHKWRRSETNLRVRLLSRFLMPIGHWEPKTLRRRLGPFMTLQSRPERCWVFLPLMSPIIIALFSLVRNESSANCVYVFLAMALLHLILVFIMIFFRPLRSMIEDWFGAAGFIITTLYLMFAAVNLAYPSARETESVMAVIVVAQIMLLFVRLVYHISHIFIARRLWHVVPHVLLFEWHRGNTRVEVDIDVDACRDMKGGVLPAASLYAELDDLMIRGEDEQDDFELNLMQHGVGHEANDGVTTSELWLQQRNLNDYDISNTELNHLLLRGPRSTLTQDALLMDAERESSHGTQRASGDEGKLLRDEFDDILGTMGS